MKIMICIYQASVEDRREAVAALTKYDLLVDNTQRQKFVTLFESSGSGKARDSLKFAANFSCTLTNEDKTTAGNHTDWRTVGEILQLNGRSLQEFPVVADALDECAYLVLKSQKEFAYDDTMFPPNIDEARPLYSRFYYTKSTGKLEEWAQRETKTLAQEAQLKNLKHLTDSMTFMEATGFEPSSSSVAIENVLFAELDTHVATLKQTYITLAMSLLQCSPFQPETNISL